MRVCVVGAGVIGSLYAGHLAQVAEVSRAHAARPSTRRRSNARRAAHHRARASFDGAGARRPPTRASCRTPTSSSSRRKATELERGRRARSRAASRRDGDDDPERPRRRGAGRAARRLAAHLGGHVHERRPPLGHPRRVRARHARPGSGPYGETPPTSAQEIEAPASSPSGLKARAFPDLRPAQWSKLIFNATVNTVAALTDLPHVAPSPPRRAPADLGHLVRDLMDEGKAVAAAAASSCDEDPWEMNVLATQRGQRPLPVDARGRPRGRPTEIDFITGALVREARAHGVPGAAAHGDVPAGPGEGGRRRVRMRVCVVGCGAVGSLFAANLAHARRRRGLGLRPSQEHVDAINANGLRLSGRRRRGRPAARDHRRRRAAAVRLRDRRDEGHAHRAAIAATAHAFADGAVAPSRTAPATRRSIAEHVERVIRGTTFPAGKMLEPGHVQWDMKGDTTIGPFEPKPGGDGRDRAARRRLHARPGCRRTRSPTRAAPQWRKVIFNASTNPVGALTGLTHGRVCEDPALRRLVSGLVTRARPSRPRRGSSSTRPRGADRPRGAAGRGLRPQGVDAPAVHGRFGLPCPVCGAPVQRIVYAENETNYCARCQTGGKVLADRSLSRLLKSSWPRNIDELE